MKNYNILEIFKNNLRNLNYANNTINMYYFFVSQFLNNVNKDSYNLTITINFTT